MLRTATSATFAGEALNVIRRDTRIEADQSTMELQQDPTTSLNYSETGSGPPIVFVHGSAGDLRTWSAQEQAFSNDYHCIRYSRRYHWPNEPIADGGEYAMSQHVADLEALIESRAAAPVHLVGHSYGAFVCLMVASRSPELVRTLSLTEPPILTLVVSVPPKPSELFRLLLRSPRTAAGIIKLGASGLGPATKASERGDLQSVLELTGKAILGRSSFASLSANRLQQARDNLIKEELLSPTYFQKLDSETARRIECPTLLVDGEHSPRIWHRLLDHLERLLPRTAIDSESRSNLTWVHKRVFDIYLWHLGAPVV